MRTLYEALPSASLVVIGLVAAARSRERDPFRIATAALGALLLTAMLMGALTSSPALRRYSEWRFSGEVTTEVTDAIDQVVADSNGDPRSVVVRSYPARALRNEVPGVRSASILSPVTIRSYLNMVHLGHQVEVVSAETARRCRLRNATEVNIRLRELDGEYVLTTKGGDVKCKRSK